MSDCDPNALLKSAVCMRCIPGYFQYLVKTYLLCYLANATVEEGMQENLIPEGAEYFGAAKRYTVLDLTHGAVYVLVWGANEVGANSLKNPGVGRISLLTMPVSGPDPSITFTGTGTVLVTASLYKAA